MNFDLHLQKSFGFVASAALACCISAGAIRANDSWPQFRGPSGQGIAGDAQVPTQFDDQTNVKWRTKIEGKGWSSPVVEDGRVWLTTAVTQKATAEEIKEKLAKDRMASMKEVAGSLELKAICLDVSSGKVLHDVSLATFEEVEPIHSLNTYASPTPFLSDGKVVCDFGNYGTWCLDAATGKEIWKTRYQVNYSVGAGSSPLVENGKVVLVCDGIDDQFVAAVDLSSGKEVWRTQRPPMVARDVEYEKAYSTPISIQVAGRTQVVVPAAQWICGYDLDSGKEIWRVKHGEGFSLSPRPIAVGDMVVFSTGYMRPDLVAVKLGGTGDVTDTHVVWRTSRGVPKKPSPIAVGDNIYMVSDDGILSQLDSKSGAILWKERLGGNYSASPIYVGNKLFFSSHEGVVTVVEAGSTYQEVASNQMDGRLLASPAVVGNNLLIRSEAELLCIGN